MFEKFIVSRVRMKLLTLFLNHPEEKFHVRNVVRTVDEEINSVRRELKNMFDIKFLHQEKALNKVFYSLDKSFPFNDELRAILTKDREDVRAIQQIISTLPNIQTALLTENFLKNEYEGNQDIDLLIVSGTSAQELALEVKNIEKRIDRVIRFTVIKPDALEMLQKKRDTFLLNIISKDKIFLVGRDKDLF